MVPLSDSTLSVHHPRSLLSNQSPPVGDHCSDCTELGELNRRTVGTVRQPTVQRWSVPLMEYLHGTIE